MIDSKNVNHSLTIDEKLQYYTEDVSIDYSYLDEWRDCRTLLNERYFTEMLQKYQYSKRQFAFSLESNVFSGDVLDIAWVRDFQKIIINFNDRDINFETGVSILAIPFVKYLKYQISKQIEDIKSIEIENSILNSVMTSLAQEIFDIFGKIFALKLAEFKSINKFVSEDKNVKFQKFLKSVLSSKQDFLEFYQEYPVATRLATVRTMYSLRNFSDLLSRLDNDSTQLADYLDKKSLKLTDISISVGDSHEQGKTVMILCFDDVKLVYKPKNLEISKAVEQFIDWFKSKSELLSLKVPKGIYKKDYSYNEFIEFEPCQSSDDVSNFYLRYGYLVAMCYLFNISDLHMENIIAQGSHPVIVDLETMFQISPEMENESITTRIMKKLEAESVRSSCLLPRDIPVGLDFKIELSAFKGVETQVPNQFVTPVNIDTDEFHYEKGIGYFKGGDNIPKRETSEGTTDVDYNQYRLKILEGFDDFMEFVLNNKDELIEFMDVFKDYKIRTLFKGTEKYASLLRYSNHPNYNKEMKYRERLFMNSWAYPYRDKRIVISEVRDLLFNDIPIFYTKTDSKDIIDSRGLIYEDYYNYSGLDIVKKKIKTLDWAEIKFQRSILLSTLDIADQYLNSEASFSVYPCGEQKFNYLKESIKIADYLMEHSIESQEELSFINLDSDKDLHWTLVAGDESLYSGTSGVALFFLELYKRTNDLKYYNAYKKIIATAVNQANFQPLRNAYQGRLAPLYPLILEYSYFGVVSEENFLNSTIEKITELNDEKIEEYFSQVDYINGISGVLCLLSKVNEIYRYKTLEEILDKFRGVLVKKITDCDDINFENVGVAHGFSGIVLGLMSAKNVNTHLVDSLLIKEMEAQIQDKDSLKWCKGLAGLIHTRINVLRVYDSEVAAHQLEAQLKTFKYFLQNGAYIKDDSICHGLSGIIMTVKEIIDHTHSTEWEAILASCVANLYIHSLFGKYNLPCINDIFSKGLFDGLSGVGLTYLYVENRTNNILSFNCKS